MGCNTENGSTLVEPFNLGKKTPPRPEGHGGRRWLGCALWERGYSVLGSGQVSADVGGRRMLNSDIRITAAVRQSAKTVSLSLGGESSGNKRKGATANVRTSMAIEDQYTLPHTARLSGFLRPAACATVEPAPVHSAMMAMSIAVNGGSVIGAVRASRNNLPYWIIDSVMPKSESAPASVTRLAGRGVLVNVSERSRQPSPAVRTNSA